MAQDDIFDLIAQGQWVGVSDALSNNTALWSAVSPKGLGLLEHALEERQDPVAEWLLMHGSAASAKRWDGQGMVHIAARNGCLRSLRIMLDRDHLLHHRDNERATPLHWASAGGQVEAVAMLLRAGARPMSKDFLGKNCLHWASEKGQLSCVITLIQACVPMHVVDKAGRTPRDLADATGFGNITAYFDSLSARLALDRSLRESNCINSAKKSNL